MFPHGYPTAPKAVYRAEFLPETLFRMAKTLSKDTPDSGGNSVSVGDNSVSVHHYCFPWVSTIRCQFVIIRDNSVSVRDNSVSVHYYCFPCIKSVSWDNSVGQFRVSSLLLLPLHQVGKLDSWEDFQDRQAMTLLTTRSTAETTEPMSSAPTANGICSLAISPAPRHGILSRSSATA